MNEGRATMLIAVGAMLLTGVGILGLAALGANGSTMFLAMLVPLCLSSYAISRVVMHYGPADKRDR
jgi:uncharacterized membrane protein